MGTVTFPTSSITTPSGDPGTLPAATVPLVGTELMEIYEGGAWKYLTTDNFTAGRVINTGGVNVTGTTIPTNGIYESAANTVGVAANGTLVASFTTTGLNSTVIGATTPAAGTFTTLTATGNILFSVAAAYSAAYSIRRDAGGSLIFNGGTGGYFFNRSDNSVTDLFISSEGVLTVKSDIAINTGSITSASGAISFDNENLTTTGTLASGSVTITTPTTPASASATGTTGTVAWDTSFIYICTATDTWKRVAIASW